jgi:hypothetical protein
MTICKDADCKKQASYNVEGKKSGLYCSNHKLEGMMNVTSKKCIHEGCKIRANYNKEGEKEALYCASHKKDGMVDVKTKRCSHGKPKSCCRQCGGSSFCEHGRYKSQCKECNGSRICEHGKYKAYCRDCDGSSFCKHEKSKRFCHECGGNGYCEHGKRKHLCKKCGATIYCEHGRQKAHCSDCSGSAICIHGKRKMFCRDCGGKGFCEHGRRKVQCKDCKGANICEHGKRKSDCKECKGSSFCIHGKRKNICRDCDGSGFCEHGKYKKFCRDCGGSGLCKNDWCTTSANRKYDNYCLRCFMYTFPDKPIVKNYKNKEASVSEYIKAKYSQFEWITDKKVQDGCSRRRPDLLLDLGYQVIIIEIDENQHTDYDCTCENKRTMELSQDVGHRPIVFIRFNPDDYVDGDKKVTSCWGLNKLGICTVKKTKKKEWEERLNALSSQIDYWIDESNKTDKTVETIQLFYNR